MGSNPTSSTKQDKFEHLINHKPPSLAPLSGISFLHRWCVEQLGGSESSEADEACEAQGAGDESLDFYIKSDKAALFTLDQCKFSELPQKHEFIPLNLQEILALLELQPVSAQALMIMDGQVFGRNSDALVASVKGLGPNI